MKRAAVLSLFGLLGLAAGPASAHHSFSMFDRSKKVTLIGTVVQFSWANPHSHIVVRVPETTDDPAVAGTWDVETNAPNILTRQGWSRRTFAAGDRITAVLAPLKDGSKAGALLYAFDKAGKRLYIDGNHGPESGPTVAPTSTSIR